MADGRLATQKSAKVVVCSPLISLSRCCTMTELALGLRHGSRGQRHQAPVIVQDAPFRVAVVARKAALAAPEVSMM